MKIDLTGRVAVIVGSGNMLDEALVDAFLECGAEVALCRKTGQHLQEAYAREDVQIFGLDLGTHVSIEDTVKRVLDAYGRIDILVNNPLGAFLETSRLPLHEIEKNEFVRFTDEWLKGLMRFSKFCVQDMVKRKQGAIVNLLSIRGIVPVANQTTAVAVSAGIYGMTRMWGVEMREWNIRANALAVGVLEDDPTLPGGDKVRFSHAGIQRPCKVWEAANAAVFLASDEASYITGTVLPVDGGIGAGYARSF